MELQTIFIGVVLGATIVQFVASILLLHSFAKNNGFLMSYKKVTLFLICYFFGVALFSILGDVFLPSHVSWSVWFLSMIALFYGFFFVTFKEATFLQTTKVFFLFTSAHILIGLFILFLLTPITNTYEPFMVSRQSMSPTYSSHDYLLIRKTGNDFLRGDVVVYERNESYFIGRLIGLPSETVTIRDGKVFINEKEMSEPYVTGKTYWDENAITLQTNEYFIMGDNREASADSRKIGVIRADQLIGEIATRVDLFSPTPATVTQGS